MDTSKFDFSGLSSALKKLNETNQPISSRIDSPKIMDNFEKTDQGFVSVQKITAKEFIKKLSAKDGKQIIGDQKSLTRVEGIVEISPKNYRLKSLLLINIEFLDTVTFAGIKETSLNIGEHIVFKDCTFLKPLAFNNCNSSDTAPLDFNQKNEAIQIINGSYVLLQIANCTFPFGVKMQSEEGNILEIDWFESYHNNFSKAGYNFENVTFLSKVDFTADKIENIGIDFRDCISRSPIRIDSILSPGIAFVGTDSIFHKDIRIWGGKLTSLIWNDGTFKSEIDISAVKIEKHFSLIGSTFEDRFTFKRKDTSGQVRNLCLPNEIYIKDCSFNNGFQFNGDKIKGNKLQIVFSEKSSGVIDIQDTFFKEVELKGNNFNNSVFLRDCSYDKLTFEKFFNRSLISLNNNIPSLNDGLPKEIRVKNSNLGNTEFYDFDFSVYPLVRVIDSRIDNIYAFGVEWFDKNQLHVDEEETSTLKILSQKREIYRQLKLASEKQSDKITSLFFKAREIQLHQEVLENKKKQSFSGKRSQISHLFQKQSDLISINLGKTNNHGQNWIMPLIWIIAITLSFYPFLMILSDPKISFAWNWTPEGWNLFWDKFGKHGKAIPQLFNPARRLSDLFENTNSFWLHFLDGLHRIILAFFIFQIVSAFRKFVK
jgi:hypothetical protein